MGRTITTLQDVAEQAGVSKTTAAAILRNAPGLRASTVTRQRVLETSARLGYRRNAIAVSLQKGRTHVIGMLIPLRDLTAYTYAQRSYPQEILVSVLEAATRVGLRIIPIAMPYDRDRSIHVNDVTDRHLDGLIVAAIYDNKFVDSVEAAGVPCVEISGTGHYVVHPDNRGGAEAAVTHLVQLGHRRIAHWHGGKGYAPEEREAGFLEAASRFGVETAFLQNANAVEILSQPPDRRPTAIFAFNDHHACAALKVARTLNLRVPEDLSVVGFDDKILAETAVPPLTTICNPLAQQAEIAVEMLQCRLRGEEPPQPHIVVPVHLVIRESTTVAPVDN